MSVYKMGDEFIVTGSAAPCCKSLILTSVLAILQKMNACSDEWFSLYIFECNPLKINT